LEGPVIAEVTIKINLDEEETEDVHGLAREIDEDARGFLGQYGEIEESRVRVLDGDQVTADTGTATVPAMKPARKQRKASKAVLANPDDDPDAKFVVNLPSELPKPVVPTYKDVDKRLRGKGAPQ
jgi:hypothetical protein